MGFRSNMKTVAQQQQDEKDVINKALKNKFAPEFLNRIDEIVIFNRLSEDNVMGILVNECKELNQTLKEVGEYDLRITKSAREIILKQGYDPKFGARPLKRSLERLVENPIAEMILKGKLNEGDVIKVKGLKGEIKIEKG